MKEILDSKSFLISALFISVLYLVSITYLMNFQLVKDTLVGNHTFIYRVDLLTALIGGMWTAMSGFGLFILILTSVLTGINLTLIFLRVSALKTSGGLKLMMGGSSLFAIVGSGCAACGLPLLALFGLLGSVAYLPLRGVELSALAVIMLSMSLYLMVKSNNRKANCDVNLETSRI